MSRGRKSRRREVFFFSAAGGKSSDHRLLDFLLLGGGAVSALLAPPFFKIRTRIQTPRWALGASKGQFPNQQPTLNHHNISRIKQWMCFSFPQSLVARALWASLARKSPPVMSNPSSDVIGGDFLVEETQKAQVREDWGKKNCTCCITLPIFWLQMPALTTQNYEWRAPHFFKPTNEGKRWAGPRISKVNWRPPCFLNAVKPPGFRRQNSRP